MVAGKFDRPDLLEPLFKNAYDGDIEAVLYYLKTGADIDGFEPQTGLAPLHVAIGTNNLSLVRLLLEHNAKVRPDARGRWPSTIAALCEVDGELSDLIADEEMKLGIV